MNLYWQDLLANNFIFGFQDGNVLVDADLHDRDNIFELKAVPNLEIRWFTTINKFEADTNITVKEVYNFSNNCIARKKLTPCESTYCDWSNNRKTLTCEWVENKKSIEKGINGLYNLNGYYHLSENVQNCQLGDKNTLDVYINEKPIKHINYYVKSQEEYENERVYIPKKRATVNGVTYESNLNSLINVTYKKLKVDNYCPKLPEHKENHLDIESIERAVEPKPYIPPNYAKIYPNTPQIVLPKVHIYDVKKLSYFRNKKEIIFVEAGSGNYAIPKKEFEEAKYLLFTEALQKRLVALGIDGAKE